jgi:tetratricopeptide (TPR) repeat protein
MNPLQQDHLGPGDNVGGNKIIYHYPDRPTPASKYLNSFAHYVLANLVGRQTQLQAITNHLQDHHLLLLHGIGGIGKTTLAKAYISQNEESYDHIAFVEMTGSITESMLIQLGDSSEIGIQLNPDLDFEAKFEQLISHLRHLPKLLLVLDNVNEAEGLRQRKSQLASLHAHVLITGRARPLVFVQERCIQEIDALTPEEARQLFSSHYTSPLTDKQQVLIKQLLQDAFYHPKLVEVIAKAAQANPFLSLEELAQLVGKKDYEDEEINYPVEIDDQAKKIYRVLLDLFDPDPLGEEAKTLHRYFAILPTIDIPVQDLAAMLGLESPEARQGLMSELNRLVYGGWLEEVNNRYFSMHGLVQWVIRQKLVLTAENCRPLIEGMGNMLAYEPTENPLSRQGYLPYTVDWLELFAQEQDEDLARTFAWIAAIYNDLGEHRQALAHHQKALAINEAVLSANHPDLALSYHNLAATYGDLGDYKLRLAYNQKALTIRQAVLPADHPNLARSYNNLAETYGALGDHQLRLAYHQKALVINEAVLPANHPDLAQSYHNLAATYGDLGDHRQALAYNQKALAINEAVLPANHPDLALSYNNLAETYGALGDHQLRLAYHQKALVINEAVLPANHPHLARSYNNLAATYGDLSNQQQALGFHQKALAINEAVLSANHSDLALSYHNLAETYGDLGDHQLRLAFHQKALTIREAILPADHPDLALSYNNLAVTYYYLNDLEQAQAYMQKAVTIRQQILSSGHPSLIASQKNLSHIQQAIMDRTQE